MHGGGRITVNAHVLITAIMIKLDSESFLIPPSTVGGGDVEGREIDFAL